jgi:superfamily I DNA/RNA helicase
MSNFKPTSQQLAIVESFKTTRVLKVNAIAGSGKTSTLELLAAANPTPSLLLAFNKAIAEEASTRFPSHVECRTMHSLAFSSFGRKLAHKLNFSQDRKKNTLRSLKDYVDWFKLSDYEQATPAISARTIVSLARDAVDRFCYSSRPKISNMDLLKKDFKDLRKTHTFDEDTLSRVLVALSKKIWLERINPVSDASATHDTYVKLWSLSNPKLNYDILYVDECQDINACVLSVLEQQTCKVLYVGDQYQSIYAFRGAVNAMKSIIAPTMRLSQSWRYGGGIAKVAEAILSKDNVEVKGNPSVESKVCPVYDMKTYAKVFRTNAALLEDAEALISKGKKVNIEINVSDFVNQVKSAVSLKQGKKPFHDAVGRFGSWWEMQEFAKEDVDTMRLVKIANRFDVDEFLENLAKANSHKEADITLTTAHKSKGLEYSNVIVADDFKFGKGDILDMPEQELNLLYVACTRAKHNLQIPETLELFMEKYDGL